MSQDDNMDLEQKDNIQRGIIPPEPIDKSSEVKKCVSPVDDNFETHYKYESCINKLGQDVLSLAIKNDIDRIIENLKVNLKVNLKKICNNNLEYLNSISPTEVKVDNCKIESVAHNVFFCRGYCYINREGLDKITKEIKDLELEKEQLNSKRDTEVGLNNQEVNEKTKLETRLHDIEKQVNYLKGGPPLKRYSFSNCYYLNINGECRLCLTCLFTILPNNVLTNIITSHIQKVNITKEQERIEVLENKNKRTIRQNNELTDLKKSYVQAEPITITHFLVRKLYKSWEGIDTHTKLNDIKKITIANSTTSNIGTLIIDGAVYKLWQLNGLKCNYRCSYCDFIYSSRVAFISKYKVEENTILLYSCVTCFLKIPNTTYVEYYNKEAFARGLDTWAPPRGGIYGNQYSIYGDPIYMPDDIDKPQLKEIIMLNCFEKKDDGQFTLPETINDSFLTIRDDNKGNNINKIPQLQILDHPHKLSLTTNGEMIMKSSTRVEPYFRDKFTPCKTYYECKECKECNYRLTINHYILMSLQYSKITNKDIDKYLFTVDGVCKLINTDNNVDTNNTFKNSPPEIVINDNNNTYTLVFTPYNELESVASREYNKVVKQNQEYNYTCLICKHKYMYRDCYVNQDKNDSSSIYRIICPYCYKDKEIGKPVLSFKRAYKCSRKSIRKSPRKSSKRPPRKSPRKSIRKSPRKCSRKSQRKSSRKSPRKSSRKSHRKSPRKSAKKSPMKNSRKSPRKSPMKNSRKYRKSRTKNSRKSRKRSKRTSKRR